MTRDAINVLLVSLEGVRADHVGSAGDHARTTPFFNRLAREGVRFPQAFTTAPARAAAYASLLTGLMPSLHGATEETGVLGPIPHVMPELLQRAGYRTAAFGPDLAIRPECGFGRGFERWYTPRAATRLTGRAAAYARRASDRVLGRTDGGARRTTQALLEWLAPADHPFFALVRFAEPLRLTPVPASSRHTTSRVAAGHGRNGRSGTIDANAAGHDEALCRIDLHLQEIADALGAAGCWERTLCIVTGVYGPLVDSPAATPAVNAFRDSAWRIPLLVRCPGRVPSGFTVDEFAQLTDLLPTVTALTGCADPGITQGRPLFRGSGATVGPTAVFAEAFRMGPHGVRRKAIRTRREKLIWQSDEDNTLYDLIRDPEEQWNVAPTDPERADRLRRALFDALAAGERWGADHGVGTVQPSPAPARRGVLE